jgi:hypothetical protein
MVERGETGRFACNLHAEDPDFCHAGTLARDVLDDSLAAGDAPGHEAPRSRLSPGSLVALTASYFYGARRERLAGDDDR